MISLLKSILFDINATTSASFWLMFYLQQFLSTCFTCDFYKYSTDEFYFLFSLKSFPKSFSQFDFNIITDMFGLNLPYLFYFIFLSLSALKNGSLVFFMI